MSKQVSINYEEDTVSVMDEELRVDFTNLSGASCNRTFGSDMPMMGFEVYVRDSKEYEDKKDSMNPLGEDYEGWEKLEGAYHETFVSSWAPEDIIVKAADVVFNGFKKDMKEHGSNFSAKKTGEILSSICEEDVVRIMKGDELYEVLSDIENTCCDSKTESEYLVDLCEDIKNELAKRKEEYEAHHSIQKQRKAPYCSWENYIKDKEDERCLE